MSELERVCQDVLLHRKYSDDVNALNLAKACSILLKAIKKSYRHTGVPCDCQMLSDAVAEAEKLFKVEDISK